VDCPATDWLSDDAFLKSFTAKAFATRTPIAGSADLTSRCNLRCVHCYLDPGECAGAPGAGPELPTGAWLRLLDEIAAEGCLYLLMTGGEPFLRDDFAALYRRARELGLVVTVFTNGTALAPGHVALFRELPPFQVELTLYGATDETCRAMTGSAGATRRAIEAVDRLAAAGVRVGLKTVLTTLNRHEYRAIERLALDRGLPFRFDGALFPRFSGDAAPVGLRVSPREIVELEMSDPKRRRSWARYHRRTRDNPPVDTLYSCGAGIGSFHIDAHGRLQPCLMAREPSADVSGGGFARAWRETMPRVRDRAAPPGFACATCPTRGLCGFCPPFFALESGREDGYSSFLCELGHLRREAISAYLEEHGNEADEPRHESAAAL
jgi:radical SAM protein with 4Fe4S-binding SPASM domain